MGLQPPNPQCSKQVEKCLSKWDERWGGAQRPEGCRIGEVGCGELTELVGAWSAWDGQGWFPGESRNVKTGPFSRLPVQVRQS